MTVFYIFLPLFLCCCVIVSVRRHENAAPWRGAACFSVGAGDTLKLRRKVEAYLLEVLLCEGQCVTRVGEEDVTAMFVDGHVRVLAPFEVGKLLGVVALDPAGFVYRYWLPAA